MFNEHSLHSAGYNTEPRCISANEEGVYFISDIGSLPLFLSLIKESDTLRHIIEIRYSPGAHFLFESTISHHGAGSQYRRHDRYCASLL